MHIKKGGMKKSVKKSRLWREVHSTSDIGSLKESCSELKDELAGVKGMVENKADFSKVLELKWSIFDSQNRMC